MKILAKPLGDGMAKIPAWAWGIAAVIVSCAFSFYLLRDQIDKWHGAEMKAEVAEQKVAIADQKVEILQDQVRELKDLAYQSKQEREALKEQNAHLMKRVELLEQRTASVERDHRTHTVSTGR